MTADRTPANATLPRTYESLPTRALSAVRA